MKVVLFSFLDDLSGDGARMITAVLKRAGHDVKSVFLPFYGSRTVESWDPELEAILQDRDLFLFSVMSCYESRAADVTRFLKSRYPKVPVIWGGVHATSLPEGCLEHADLVIRGEAEEATLEFCRRYEAGEDWSDSPNLCYHDENGKYVQNRLLELPFDMDAYPFPDYDIEDHFLLDGANVVKMTPELLERYHTVYFHDVPTYFVITTRGCPFACTYCHQSELVTTYPTREYKSRVLRYKSVERTIEEVRTIRERFPFFQAVGFSDDDFFARSVEEIREFGPAFKSELGLPFGVAAIPSSITEEKLQVLLDAGMTMLQIGIQSGSDRLNREVYRRYLPKEKLLQAVELIEKYHGKYEFGVDCDWIIDCPWETDLDVQESLELSLQLPEWMRFNIFTLTFYPGTVMWHRAVAEDLIDPEHNPYEQAFNKLREEGHSYMTYVFLLRHRARRFASDRMIRTLTSKPARWIGRRLPGWVLNGLWGRKAFPTLAQLCHSEAYIGGGHQFS